MQYMHDQTGSGFIYLSMIIAPVAYYRFGSWAICWLEDDKKKLIEQLVDYEELKTENERLKKQLVKQE